MKLISKEITTAQEWYEYLDKELWGGADKRWQDMSEKEREYLVYYMHDTFADEVLTPTDINDFVWFDSDELLEEYRQNEQ